MLTAWHSYWPWSCRATSEIRRVPDDRTRCRLSTDSWLPARWGCTLSDRDTWTRAWPSRWETGASGSGRTLTEGQRGRRACLPQIWPGVTSRPLSHTCACATVQGQIAHRPCPPKTLQRRSKGQGPGGRGLSKQEPGWYADSETGRGRSQAGHRGMGDGKGTRDGKGSQAGKGMGLVLFKDKQLPK